MLLRFCHGTSAFKFMKTTKLHVQWKIVQEALQGDVSNHSLDLGQKTVVHVNAMLPPVSL